MARALEVRSASAALDDSSLLILLSFLDSFGHRPNQAALAPVVDRLRSRFARNVNKLRRLDVAAKYWIIAYALVLHGVEVGTEPLSRLARRLPRVSARVEPESRRFIDGFNYATHRVLFETRYLRVVAPELAADRCVQWLQEFWERTSMRADVEYASDFLTCTWAAGVRVPSSQIETTLSRIARQQSPSGCWPLATGESRYNRFHSPWCATEALHLGSRMLRAAK